MLLPSEASVHKHREMPCYGGPHNRENAEFVYYMAHIENAARIICWGLYAHHLAKSLPDRKVIADDSVMSNFGRREHRKFVNLYFGTHTAMQHVITCGRSRLLDEKDMVFLRFNADDLFALEGAKFSDGNVASNTSRIYSAEEESDKLRSLKWNVILCQKKYAEGLKRWKMSELLVPHYIPPSYIHSAVVLNSESEEKLLSLMKEEDPEGYDESLNEIINDSVFDPPFDEDDIALEANQEVDIIRDGMGRHFFSRGDGDGGYNVDNEWSVQEQVRNIKLPDPEDYL